MGFRGEALDVRDTPRVADRVYLRLRESVLNGEFEPGERMRQSEVANHFAVSQTPVREALARLANDGLVVLQPRRGAIVKRLLPSEIDEVYELRELIDPYVASKTATVAGQEQLRKISVAANDGLEPGLSSSELFEVNRLFHQSIYEAGGNERMVELFDWLWNSVTAIRMFDTYVADPEELAKMNREHIGIAAALSDRDGALASELVHRHVAAARRDLIDLLENTHPEGNSKEK